jgi:hypothetical protein
VYNALCVFDLLVELLEITQNTAWALCNISQFMVKLSSLCHGKTVRRVYLGTILQNISDQFRHNETKCSQNFLFRSFHKKPWNV